MAASIALRPEELAVLRAVLVRTAVKKRTGEAGVIHAGRFVSNGLVLRKADLNALGSAFEKLGVQGPSRCSG